jgi:hypothetical protein
MKKYIFTWMAVLTIALFAISACTPGINNSGDSTVNVLFNILSQRGGTWRVNRATFGDEEAPLDMFANYRIVFRPDGTYQVVNPDGAPSFTRNANGTYTVKDRLLTFDGGATTANEVSVGALNANRLVFEFTVILPGKSATLYRFELVR